MVNDLLHEEESQKWDIYFIYKEIITLSSQFLC